jgi:lipopolysaccharide transport system permease protein
MYASAIFYSLSKVPPKLLLIVAYNPLAVVIDQARNVVLWDVPHLWGSYGVLSLPSFVVMILGYAFFMRTKRGFADVI